MNAYEAGLIRCLTDRISITDEPTLLAVRGLLALAELGHVMETVAVESE